MNSPLLAAVALPLLLAATGCSQVGPASTRSGTLAGLAFSEAAPAAQSRGSNASSAPDPMANRMVIWNASLQVQVSNLSNAVTRATARVEAEGGYVEQNSDHGETSARLTLRVPAKGFRATVAGLEGLGEVTYRSVRGDDVTEQYVDIEARLKNLRALRDRLKLLLDKAVDVKDVLAIETELTRVQSDLDSLEGRLQALKGRVDFATITLDLERKPILGPVGYVGKGLWWGLKKLFILRE
jgi:hypothetical protein